MTEAPTKKYSNGRPKRATVADTRAGGKLLTWDNTKPISHRRRIITPFGPGRSKAYAAYQAHIACFTVRERDLQKQLGVGNKAMVKMRCANFTFDIDWIRKSWSGYNKPASWGPNSEVSCNGYTVWYKPEAAKRLLELFVQNPNVEVAKQDEFFLEVVKSNYLNNRILQAKDGAGSRMMVRVPDASKFVPGMKIKAARAPSQDVLQLVGRGPRWRGKW